MGDHIANVGPLTISIDEPIIINHLVQLVGYGTDADSGLDYWLVRNSWGSGWGEDGYIRLIREATPPCGEDPFPLVGTGCVDDNVPIQTVCGQCGILYDTSYPIDVVPAA